MGLCSSFFRCFALSETGSDPPYTNRRQGSSPFGERGKVVYLAVSLGTSGRICTRILSLRRRLPDLFEPRRHFLVSAWKTLVRQPGFAPGRPVWKTGMLSVKHHWRLGAASGICALLPGLQNRSIAFYAYAALVNGHPRRGSHPLRPA